MLAQRFLVLCDSKGCKAKTKATVTLKMSQAVRGVMEPICLVPTNLIFAEKGWTFAWNGEKKTTETLCPEHGVK